MDKKQELEQAVQQEKQERAELAMAEIRAILEKAQCKLVPVVEIVGGQITQSVQIMAE